jgi:hypothetical protein
MFATLTGERETREDPEMEHLRRELLSDPKVRIGAADERERGR